ncbi:MAG: MarR family transcriptional regulator [Flavobacteriales bacterium]|nr:MarR family transcriptional regulator [Flavobacteriales bacterium]
MSDSKIPLLLDQTIVPWVGKTMKSMDHFISSKLSEVGINLTRQQLVLMKVLRRDGPLPQNDLAFLTERDKTSLTRLLSGMEKKNLVARIASSEDKRVNLVHLTKNGEKVLNEIAPKVLSIIQEIQEGVSEEDREAVIRVMKQIQENIGKHVNSCSSNK